jgi:hypothetical protein
MGGIPMKALLIALTLVTAPAFARNNCAHAPYTSEEFGTVAHSANCGSGFSFDGKCLNFKSNNDRAYLQGVVDHWGGTLEMGLCLEMNLETGSLLLVDYPRYTD